MLVVFKAHQQTKSVVLHWVGVSLVRVQANSPASLTRRNCNQA